MSDILLVKQNSQESLSWNLDCSKGTDSGWFGKNERNKNKNRDRPRWTMNKPSKSSIGLITEYTDDLTGLDPNQETDAAQHDLNLHVSELSSPLFDGTP